MEFLVGSIWHVSFEADFEPLHCCSPSSAPLALRKNQRRLFVMVQVQAEFEAKGKTLNEYKPHTNSVSSRSGRDFAEMNSIEIDGHFIIIIFVRNWARLWVSGNKKRQQKKEHQQDESHLQDYRDRTNQGAEQQH